MPCKCHAFFETVALGMEKPHNWRGTVFTQANSRISGTLSGGGVSDRLKESQNTVFHILSSLDDNKDKPQTSSGDGTKMWWASPPAKCHRLFSLSQPRKSMP